MGRASEAPWTAYMPGQGVHLPARQEITKLCPLQIPIFQVFVNIYSGLKMSMYVRLYNVGARQKSASYSQWKVRDRMHVELVFPTLYSIISTAAFFSFVCSLHLINEVSRRMWISKATAEAMVTTTANREWDWAKRFKCEQALAVSGVHLHIYSYVSTFILL